MSYLEILSKEQNRMLDSTYEFLQKNRRFPRELRNGYSKETLLPFVGHSKEDRAFALLHGMLFTQSQPNLENVRKLFVELYGKGENESPQGNPLTSMEAFCSWVKPDFDSSQMFHQIWEGLKQKPAYGQKTAAIFLKEVYQIHHHPELKDLRFWDDVPILSKNDFLPIPVDRVILHIFNEFIPKQISKSGNEKNWTFSSINDVLWKHENNDHLLWDDLWYWGFITQRTQNKKRVTSCFNEGKYWTWRHAPKDFEKREEIKKLANKFVKQFSNTECD